VCSAASSGAGDELKNETPAGERLSRECVPQVVWTFLQDPGRAECGILLAASRKLSRPTSPRMVVKVKRDDFSVESDPGVAVFLREARATIARSGVSIVRVTVPGCWDSRRSGCIARRKSRPCSSPRVRH
jgi:hypothetical protein